MRGNCTFGMALVVALGATAAARAGEMDVRPPGSGSGLFYKLFGRKDPPPEKKPAEPTAKDKDKDKAKKPASPVKSPTSRRSKELTNYLRRMAVCDQLMQVAYDTKDDDLQREVEQLRERVWATYQVRTEQLPSGGKKPESDDQILEKHLGGKTAAKEAVDDVLLGSTPRKNSSSRTARKEDEP